MGDLGIDFNADDSGRHASRLGRGLLAALVAVTVAVGGCGLLGASWLRSRLIPDDHAGPGYGEVIVQIEPGSTATGVGEALHAAGVIASAGSFTQAAAAEAKVTSIRPGSYRLRKNMKASLALAHLFDPASRVVTRITVPEGLRLYETLDLLARRSGIALRDFQRLASKPADLGLPSYAGERLEGFLFPATYDIEPGEGAREILSAMVARYHQAAEQVDLEGQAKAGHLTPFEAVVVASLVQAEGGRDEDYPKIARVIYNRLRKHDRLQFCSTVLYVQKRHGLWVSYEDTKVDSPYNTYRKAGLPPGPIASPGEAALKAALHPAQGDWYWFVTTDPVRKITKFTARESEFAGFRDELARNLRAPAGD